jgi:hypothetical protein
MPKISQKEQLLLVLKLVQLLDVEQLSVGKKELYQALMVLDTLNLLKE